MERLPQMDREAYKKLLRAKMEKVLDEVVDAVDGAAAGRLIRDSEEKVRDAFARLRQEAYQDAMQMKIDVAEKTFPPSLQRKDGSAEAS